MINTFNTENFTDLKDLDVDKTKAKQERLKQFIADVKNPYMVRVGDTLVKIEFTGGKNFKRKYNVISNLSCKSCS